MRDEPEVLPEDDRPPLFPSWRSLYLAILLWELVVIGVIAALTRWID